MAMYTFGDDLHKFAKKAELDLNTVVRKVSFDLWNNVTRRTPVDTGRARGSWNITEEVTDLSTKAPKQKGEKYPANVKGNVGQITGKRAVYITNNVEYIEYLEDGWSDKAPAGMVKVAIAEEAAKLKAFKG